jgi:hypothetical protein
LKDRQLPSLQTELRSYRLIGSGMNKMVRGAFATLPTLRGAAQMSDLKILGTTLILTLGGVQSLFAQAAISEPGAYAFYHPDADVLNAGRPAFHSLESTNAFASETRVQNGWPRSDAAVVVATPSPLLVQMTRASQPTSRIGSNACMTEYLVAARAAIILWTSLAVMPAEIVFDAIEAELERRGVES